MNISLISMLLLVEDSYYDIKKFILFRFQINYQFPMDFRVEKVKTFYTKVLNLENKLLENFRVEQFWQEALNRFGSETLFTPDDASKLLFEIGMRRKSNQKKNKQIRIIVDYYQ